MTFRILNGFGRGGKIEGRMIGSLGKRGKSLNFLRRKYIGFSYSAFFIIVKDK